MNVGIVGCGRITGLRHLPALRRIAGANVLALADVDADRLDALAGAYGVPRRYRGHLELVADPDVDAVAVCVPASLHTDVALAALEAGKHVLIEKPLCLRLEDATRLRDAAAGVPVTVMLGFNMRWHRLVCRARELIRAGALGELEAVRTAFTSSFDYRGDAHEWRFHRDMGGGALFEMGPHHLDLWRFLTGREVEEVHASSRSSRDEDETVVVSAALEGGARASSLLSQRTTNVNEIEVFGERGRARLSLYRYDGLELQLGKGFGGDVGHRLRGLVRAAAELPAFARSVRRGSDFVEAYAAEWRHFLDRAAAERPAAVGLEDGIRNLEVLLAAAESIRSGRTVPVARPAATVGA